MTTKETAKEHGCQLKETKGAYQRHRIRQQLATGAWRDFHENQIARLPYMDPSTEYARTLRHLAAGAGRTAESRESRKTERGRGPLERREWHVEWAARQRQRARGPAPAPSCFLAAFAPPPRSPGRHAWWGHSALSGGWGAAPVSGTRYAVWWWALRASLSSLFALCSLRSLLSSLAARGEWWREQRTATAVTRIDSCA
jgi:hypothetical protein